MHARKLDRSFHLRCLRDLLAIAGAEGVTGAEIASRLHCLNPATEISELRKNGVPVRCEYQGKSESGRRIYRYFCC